MSGDETHHIPSATSDEGTPESGRLPKLTLLFAVAAGLSVANIYVAQPLLDTIARDLKIDPAIIGIIVTMTQVGYAFGLILIVPLGDLLDRRRLIVCLAAFSAIALLIVATAPNAIILLMALVAVGFLAVLVQVLVAVIASLAPADARGRAVGTVTSGIVIGILLARFFSGLLADIGGWRSVYFTAAALMLGITGVLWRVLPRHRPSSEASSYTALLRSTVALFIDEPGLRSRAMFALLIFATFSTFWTAIVLPLSAPPFSLSHTAIGLLGVAGVAGAVAAGGAGRLADRGWAQWTTGLSLAFMVAAWLPIACLSYSVWPLVAGVVLLDMAVQAVHVTNQSLIFKARPEAHSRLVSGYMVFYSIGSACGSIASTMMYARAGWTGVCLLGASFSAAALLFWFVTDFRTNPTDAMEGAQREPCNASRP